MPKEVNKLDIDYSVETNMAVIHSLIEENTLYLVPKIKSAFIRRCFLCKALLTGNELYVVYLNTFSVSRLLTFCSKPCHNLLYLRHNGFRDIMPLDLPFYDFSNLESPELELR